MVAAFVCSIYSPGELNSAASTSKILAPLGAIVVRQAVRAKVGHLLSFLPVVAFKHDLLLQAKRRKYLSILRSCPDRIWGAISNGYYR